MCAASAVFFAATLSAAAAWSTAVPDAVLAAVFAAAAAAARAFAFLLLDDWRDETDAVAALSLLDFLAFFDRFDDVDFASSEIAEETSLRSKTISSFRGRWGAFFWRVVVASVVVATALVRVGGLKSRKHFLSSSRGLPRKLASLTFRLRRGK